MHPSAPSAAPPTQSSVRWSASGTSSTPMASNTRMESPGAPDEGGGGAEEEAGRPGGRRQVHEVHLAAAGVQPERPHHQRHGDGAEQAGDRHRAQPRPHQGDEGQRPQQVELLLDRQAPQVAQQRWVAGVVRHVADDLAPVAEVAERPRHVPSHAAALLRRPDGERHHRHHREDDGERRQQPPCAPQPEPPEVGAERRLVLVEQERRDQEPGDDEEHLDADPPAVHPREPGVVADHGDDRQGAQPVEPRLVPEAPPAGTGRPLDLTRRVGWPEERRHR